MEDEGGDFGSGELKRSGTIEVRGVLFETFKRRGDTIILKPTSPEPGSPLEAHNLTQTPLDSMNFNGLLGTYSVAMMSAAEKFAGDYQKAGLRPKQGMSLDRTGGSGEIAQRTADTRAEWNKAVKHLGIYGNIVITTVCDLKPPLPGQLIQLKLGLLRLANYYGYFTPKNA